MNYEEIEKSNFNFNNKIHKKKSLIILMKIFMSICLLDLHIMRDIIIIRTIMVHSMKYLFIVTPIVHGCPSLMIAFRIHLGLSFVKLQLVV